MKRFLVFIICILMLTGCSGAADSVPEGAAGTAAADSDIDGNEASDAGASGYVGASDAEASGYVGASGAEASGTAALTVTDAAGQVHIVPDDRENLTIASVYAVSVPFITALDLSGRVLAINVKSRFWTDSVPALAAAGSVGRGVVDMETLAGYAPDVLIHRANDSATVEAVTGRLGIPVLCIQVESFDDILSTLDIMGVYFGAQERARQVSDMLTEKSGMIDDIVSRIPEGERVRALAMGSMPYRVAGGDMLQSWMIEKAGGICVAADIANNRNWSDIGTEKVFELNPDFIFCTSSTVLDYSIDKLLSDSTWSAVSAVIDKNIYQIPALLDSWDLPGISPVLGTMYMLHMMYPEYLSSDELQREIDEYYMFMFGKTFGSGYLGYEIG